MPLNRRPQIMSSALKTLTAAVASAVFLSSAASAAGLGKLTVLSALGQPLRAEIELTAVSNDEAAGLVAKLASLDAYRAANIEFNPALLSLRFNVEQRGGRQFVRISSTQPLNEPFVDLLLELAWDNGRLVREYTFLLDPAELRAPQPAQVAAAPAAQRPRTSAPAPATAAAADAPTQAAAPASRAQRAARADERAAAAEQDAGPRAPNAASRYRVRKGDTLSGIATRMKPNDVSLDMMLVALYRANPDAFIGNNMNRLKSGQILSVPDGDALRGGDAEAARGTVVAHAADFDAYRAKLAGQVATSTPAREAAPGQSATGRITAKVEERPTAANESQDQLRLSKATPAPASGAAGATTTANATAEDSIAREKELADAQQRVKELEKNVNQLEDLITVKSGAGAAAAGAAAEGVKPLAPANEAAEAPAQPAPKIKPKAVQPAAPPEKSLFDTLMDNITVIGAGVAVLALAALGLSQRRKKKPVPKGTAGAAAAAEPTILGAAAQPSSAQSLYAETGGQSVDTNDSVFNSSFAPSASQLDTNEVDPLAEAELYLAYNFDTQAEDILKEALRNDPLRHPVRLKLLEIYAARKDVRAFETQATELYSLTGGKGDEWAQAASLGLALDPANPMYAGAAGTGIGAGAVAAGAAGLAAGAIAADDNNPQTLLSQQLEQAFRSRNENTEIIEPVATTDAVTGAPLDAGFDLGTLSLDKNATALPHMGDDTATPSLDAKADDNLLDFDLGGLSFEPVPATEPSSFDRNDATAVPDLQFDMEPFAPLEPAASAAGTVADSSLDDLSFDMDFDAQTAEPAPQQSSSMLPDDDDDGFVLDLSKNGPNTDIDLAELAKEFELPPLPEVPQSPAEASLNDPLFDLDAMDFSLADDTPVTPATPAAPAADLDFANDLDLDFAPNAAAEPLAHTPAKDPLFDLDTMDFGQPAAPAAPQDDPFALDAVPAIPNPGTPVPRFDMDSFDLDLPAGELDLADTAAPEAAGAPAELTPAQMEMETKLDLAIAYQEIGDKEGARELLDEVIKGGSSEQATRASAMRAQLA